MRFGKVALAVLLAAAISLGTTFLGERWVAFRSEQTAGVDGGAAELESLPDFALPDPEGRETAIARWAGKVLVLNFWATWCPPCARELPHFSAAQQSLGGRGVQVVGIAVDRPEDVRAFLAERPVNYPILIADAAAVELARRIGNPTQGLPFTAIFDGRGRRVFSHTGELSAADLQAQLERLVEEAAGTSRPDFSAPPS